MSPEAQAFKTANAESPVVKGRVAGLGGAGGTFHLADGRKFKLTADDCKAVAPMNWRRTAGRPTA